MGVGIYGTCLIEAFSKNMSFKNVRLLLTGVLYNLTINNGLTLIVARSAGFFLGKRKTKRPLPFESGPCERE